MAQCRCVGCAPLPQSDAPNRHLSSHSASKHRVADAVSTAPLAAFYSFLPTNIFLIATLYPFFLSNHPHTQRQPIMSTQTQSKQLKEYTRDEVAKHNKKGDIWIVIDSQIYNVSKFVELHPGGESVLCVPNLVCLIITQHKS